MEITVNIPDQLATEAKARGIELETYVEQLLAQQAAATSNGMHKPRNPSEVRAWLDSLAQFSDKIPALPETISRDWIYQDHN